MIINDLNAEITDQVYQRLLTSIEMMVDELPFMISLTPDERKAVQSVGDGRLPYVLKCLEYAKAHRRKIGISTEDLEELEAIALLFTQVGELNRRVDDLRVSLRDTLMMIGAIYYRLCRAVHAQMRIAYDRGRPGIERMLDDLDKLYENQGNTDSSSDTEDKGSDTPLIPGNQQTNAPGDGGTTA